MARLKNTEGEKLFIRLEIIDNPVTTISVKESRCVIDTHVERGTPQCPVAAKYSLNFMET